MGSGAGFCEFRLILVCGRRGCLRGFTAAGGFCDLYMLVVFDFRVFCVVSWHNICFCVFVWLVSDSE